MKKIGMSIPWDYLADNITTRDSAALNNTYGPSDNFLSFLKGLNVTHVELRHRKKTISEADMMKVFKKLLDLDFSITVHGDALRDKEYQSVNDFLPWFEAYNKTKQTEIPVMVTLHPVTGSDNDSLLNYNKKTVALINQLSKIIADDNLPIRLALENQRSKENSISGTSFLEVEKMWRELNSDIVGTCWDMGHCVANHIIDKKEFPLFPHDAFASAAVHTHIHDIGPSGGTHWFFKENIVPLKDYIQTLKSVDYKGVYNLELSFSRFEDQENQREQLEKSIIKLRELI